MLRKVLGALLLLTFVFAPMTALGKMLPDGKWWRNPHVVKQLNLSEEQISAMDDAFVEHSRNLIRLKSAVEQEQFELGVLIDSRELNEEAVMKQVKKLEKEKADLSAEFWRLVLTTRKVVGYENFRKLKESAEKKAKQKIRRFIGQEDHRKGKKPTMYHK